MLIALSAIMAQPAAPASGFEGMQVYTEQQAFEIQIKALIPDITIFKLKTDTYNKPGLYRYSVNLDAVQKVSKDQLNNWQEEINKWLEESK